MAMAQRPRPGWASYHHYPAYHQHNNNCQDVGNSILLLLGLIICINIGINMLWSRFQVILYQVFCAFCEKEAPKPAPPPEKQTQSLKKQCIPEVRLRCTMDPVKMTVTPPPVRRHHQRGSLSHRAQRPIVWAPDTDDDEKPSPQHPAVCAHHCDGPKNWEACQSVQGIWAPWMQDTLEPTPTTIRFQSNVEGRPHKTDFHSELGLEAYVYPVNPPPPSPEAPCHKNTGGAGAGAVAETEPAQCQPQPALPPALGPAIVPEFPRRRSSVRIVYDARDVRRRLRELTREVEALSRCYPIASGSSTAEGTSKDWVYRSLAGSPGVLESLVATTHWFFFLLNGPLCKHRMVPHPCCSLCNPR
ncbi:spermatid maturation protein 1 isoform X2 [Ochotona princeps]|uniref:spermatid maturation protein 1 isoform X2 n=1 Tax=Ochotona princeps TaxID=9978 RepID=UPI002714EB61|nr:spermatid maturation protein 1 isoform X2 [Ochotona princeps]